MRINSKEELQSKKAEIEQNIQNFTCRVLVCSGTGCIASGAQKIYDEMVRLCEGIDGVEIEMQKDIPHVGVIKTGCQGLCELGPLVRIEPYGYQYVHVQEEDCLEIVERTVRLGHPVDRLFYRHGDEVCPKPEDIPFLNRQTRIVLENCGKIDAESIDEYIAAGGFSALAKAVTEMTPQDVIDEVTRSGLRGRGGAGFPAGKKWSQVARQAEKIRYVVCNGDEGDPGAFMDGSVMEGDPYKMIEGMIIAAYAVGAENGYIYVRAEYPLSVARLRLAISQAEKYGLLGENILGSGVNFHLHINRGAGAFVCGEGSALTSSIEGNRGMPRVKPPRTVEKGLWGKPTVLNNVETYANVPKIIIQGADWFHTIGTEGSPGTKTFSLTGAIENTGLIEVPMGFCYHPMDKTYRLMKKFENDVDTYSLQEKYLSIMKKAAAAIRDGGFHTPNHRWAICAALMQAADVFAADESFAKSCKARTEKYFNEGIDGNADGEYAERSTGGYNCVVNPFLSTIH